MSIAEVIFVTQRAERWRGKDGERRKTVVLEATRTLADGAVERTTRMSVYTLSVDGDRALYREFLRLYNGETLELFETVSDYSVRVLDALGAINDNLANESGVALGGTSALDEAGDFAGDDF